MTDLRDANPIITLLTDFGTSDGYVGAMKGVILSLCPSATIVDITHGIAPQDVAEGAFVLSSVAPRFPRGTVHVAVVDPGVGSARRGIVVEAHGHVFVGPDNGLFTFALDGSFAAYDLPSAGNAAATFHGRDVFAPAAARIAAGAAPDSFGKALPQPLRLPAWQKSILPGAAEGCVIHVDHFGNVVTNLRPEDAPGGPAGFSVPGRGVPNDLPIRRTFSDVPHGQALWYVGSDGFYELAVREGNAAQAFGIRRGDRVVAALKTP